MHLFPILDAGAFLAHSDHSLTAEASTLGFPPGVLPHGSARGISLSGLPEDSRQRLDRAAFFLVDSGEWGWRYRSATSGMVVTILND